MPGPQGDPLEAGHVCCSCPREHNHEHHRKGFFPNVSRIFHFRQKAKQKQEEENKPISNKESVEESIDSQNLEKTAVMNKDLTVTTEEKKVDEKVEEATGFQWTKKHKAKDNAEQSLTDEKTDR